LVPGLSSEGWEAAASEFHHFLEKIIELFFYLLKVELGILQILAGFYVFVDLFSDFGEELSSFLDLL
jgi:hypothetical protein